MTGPQRLATGRIGPAKKTGAVAPVKTWKNNQACIKSALVALEEFADSGHQPECGEGDQLGELGEKRHHHGEQPELLGGDARYEGGDAAFRDLVGRGIEVGIGLAGIEAGLRQQRLGKGLLAASPSRPDTRFIDR